MRVCVSTWRFTHASRTGQCHWKEQVSHGKTNLPAITQADTASRTTSILTKCSRHASTDDEDVDDNFAVLEKGINKEWIPLQAMQLTCFESIFNGIICKWLRWHALITSTALLSHSHSVFDRDHHYIKITVGMSRW